MKKHIVVITCDDIRSEIETAVAEAEEESQINFPSDESRIEFIEDCTDCVSDKYDAYEHYRPDYRATVLDTARIYGYQL